MTQKDLELIARYLAALNPGKPGRSNTAEYDNYKAGYSAAIKQVCGALSSGNPRLDRDRFLAACQAKGGM